MNIDTSVVGITIPQGAVKNIKRGAEMLWQDGGLPTAFQRCEYIESTGTQYIDTGMYGDSRWEYSCYILFTQLNGAFGIFGARGSSASILNIGAVCEESVATILVDLANSDYNKYRATARNINTGIVYKFIISQAKRGVYVGETTVAENKTVSSEVFTTSFTISLFKENNNAFHTNFAKGKVYRFSAKFSSDTIFDFVPCYLKTAWNGIPAGTIGLYDLCGSICPLTNTPFYTNAGTGAFTKGADVV